MSLHIRAVAPPAPGRLRQLLLESLPQLLGSEAQALPSAGHLPVDTVVAVDAYQRLWVLSFTTHDPGSALLDGMRALQQVRDLLPWMKQARLVNPDVEECSLLVLSPELPNGTAELCLRAGIDWRRLRFLEVNGELGLLIEPGEPLTLQMSHNQAPAQPAPRPATLTPLGRENGGKGSGLTPEEEAFFQHL